MESAPVTPSKTPGSARELRHYLNVLRKRWRVITTVLVVSLAVAFVYTIRQPKIYEATSSLVIESTAPGCKGLRRELRLVAGGDSIEWVGLDDQDFDTVLIIAGCDRACPEQDLEVFPYRVISIKHDRLDAGEIIKALLSKGEQ